MSMLTTLIKRAVSPRQGRQVVVRSDRIAFGGNVGKFDGAPDPRNSQSPYK